LTASRQSAGRSLKSDLLFLLALAAFLGCLHHAVRSDRPLFAAPRNPDYAQLITLSAQQVREVLGQPGVVLVDARGESAYRAGTLPGSLSLPLHRRIKPDIMSRLAEASRVIVFCGGASCHTSKEMAVRLRKQGLRSVEVYPGGLSEWKALDYPVQPGSSP
jgi:rhodanese-related sulfurtransferase